VVAPGREAAGEPGGDGRRLLGDPGVAPGTRGWAAVEAGSLGEAQAALRDLIGPRLFGAAGRSASR
jgi:hypothetical protein